MSSHTKSPEVEQELTEAQAKKILRELAQRAKAKAKLDGTKFLFGEQKRFVESEQKYRLACTSRQAGKSTGLAYAASQLLLKKPKSLGVYITTARETAKDIIWPAFQMIDDEFELGLEFKQHTGEVVFPNGSKMILRGAGSKREVDKLRGPVYSVVIVDEAQNFGKLLKYMLDEALDAATMRHDAPVILAGTPNASCSGPFYEFSRNEEWDSYNWIIDDNPHIKDIKRKLERTRATRGWTETSPAYLREYRGQWVRDEKTLVFDFNERRNTVPTFAQELYTVDDWEYLLGVDVGFNDPMGFAVLAYSADSGQVRVVRSYKEEHLAPTAAAVHVERFMQEFDLNKIVIDTGGIGKGYAEEWKSRFRWNIIPAQKQNKAAYIEFMNSDLRSGVLKLAVDGNEEAIDELTLLQWDLNKLARGQFDFDRGYADHLADAILYGWRECRHFAYDSEHGIIGSQNEFADEEERMWEKRVAKMQYDTDTPWWQKLKDDLWR